MGSCTSQPLNITLYIIYIIRSCGINKLVAPHGITLRSQGRVCRPDIEAGQDDLPCPFQRTGVFLSKS